MGALSLVNHFYWKSEETKTALIAVDVVVILYLRFLEKTIQKKKEMVETAAAKKNDNEQQIQKAENRATKSQTRSNNKKKHKKRETDYKTHEKRNHHPTTHHIQQPSKINAFCLDVRCRCINIYLMKRCIILLLIINEE